MNTLRSAFILFLSVAQVGAFSLQPSIQSSRQLNLSASGGSEEESIPALKEESKPAQKEESKPAQKGHKKEGLLSPFVVLGKEILGEKELTQVRAQVIKIHSKVIGQFVDTAGSDTGEIVVKALFELADVDNNGTVDEKELSDALKAIGLKMDDKTIDMAFNRTDKDSSGSIDYEEWKKALPKILKQNLAKLAKINGSDMGLLV